MAFCRRGAPYTNWRRGHPGMYMFTPALCRRDTQRGHLASSKLWDSTRNPTQMCKMLLRQLDTTSVDIALRDQV
ncbi:hypothetical protein GGTG_06761 [Gaeumannomyces tritici R3-111a-1]|uniref:Uncharacterized protein n=1 Tax=Gaeumannomyces tritici (strain R3-111a-1) TaxID=644352 RepID=J3NZR4_GAET3|nr:hypothetical protein GGTG_06761 [Gaeumannomyces tritici R3-111a-1]EJT76847.1 hypothetical protein GGTG_06761 [Gaeumannomyces tritici R3-111a-1]